MPRFVVVLLIGLFASGGCIAEVLDQQQPTVGEPRFLFDSPEEWVPLRYAQTFTVTRSGRVSRIELPLRCGSGERLVEYVKLELARVDASGRPGETLLSLRYPNRSLPPAVDGWLGLNVSFPPAPVEVTAGDRLALIVGGPDHERCTFRAGPATSLVPDAYPDGQAFWGTFPHGTPSRVVWRDMTDGYLDLHPGSSLFNDLAFKIHIEDGPRTFGDGLCSFTTAYGGANSWIPADLPICGCLRDGMLPYNRCSLEIPGGILVRELQRPKLDELPRVDVSVLPLEGGMSRVVVDVLDLSKTSLLRKPVVFDEGLAKGELHELRGALLRVPDQQQLIEVAIDGKRYHYLVDVPTD